MKITIEVEKQLPSHIANSPFGADSHLGLITTVETGGKTRHYRDSYNTEDAGELVTAMLKAYDADKEFEPDDIWVRASI